MAWEEALAAVRHSHTIFHSACLGDHGVLKCDSGGFVVLVDRSILNGLIPDFAPLIPGRAVRIVLPCMTPGSTCVFHFVHNHGLSVPQMANFESSFQGDLAESLRDPKLKSVFLLGDFNIEPIGDKRVLLTEPPTKWEDEFFSGE